MHQSVQLSGRSSINYFFFNMNLSLRSLIAGAETLLAECSDAGRNVSDHLLGELHHHDHGGGVGGEDDDGDDNDDGNDDDLVDCDDQRETEMCPTDTSVFGDLNVRFVRGAISYLLEGGPPSICLSKS